MVLDANPSRRRVIGLLGLTTGAALAAPLVSRLPAGATLTDPPVLPGQIGDATAAVTPAGTAYWIVDVFAATGSNPADDYHRARVLLPVAFDLSVATPTVLVVHGATALEDCVTRPGGMATLAQSWIDLGWAVIATREGSTVTTTGKGTNGKWGNEPSRRAMADAWRWVNTAWTPDPRGFLVLGFSMGGGAALNFANEARRQQLPIAGVYSIDGATNLADCSNRNANFHKQIKLAYGLPNYHSGDASWVAKVDAADGGHDANKFTTGLLAFPLRFSASPNDTTVLLTKNTTPLYAALAAANWDAELGILRYTGGHCAAKHFLPKDVNPFFIRAIRRTNRIPDVVFTSNVDGAHVTFDGRASRDPDGYLVSSAWDFGDGTVGSGLTTSHDYLADGDYTVTLTATDNSGGSSAASAVISIRTTPPPTDPPPTDPPPEG
jgi:PKD repeat protein